MNVKPLVWEWIGPDWRALDPWAESYTITMEDDGYLLIHDCLISHDVFATLDLAQAAAQADYEARIMSALLPPVSA